MNKSVCSCNVWVHAALPLLLALLLSGGEALAMSARRSGELRVTTHPEGAVIACDGHEYGTSPVTLPDVGEGTHLLVARKDGFREARKTVSLLAGQQMAVSLDLDPVHGLILLQSEPEGAAVEIGGAYRGKTPLLVPDFPLGTHRVRLASEGYLDKEIEVTVEDRIPRRIETRLVSDSAVISFTSQPAGAVVRINGIQRGTTPCEVAGIPTGEVGVELTLPHHVPHEERITLRAGDQRELRAVLEPVPSLLRVVSIPEEARVYVDDQYKGVTPVDLEPLSAGRYRLRVEKNGYEIVARDVDLGSAEDRTEEFRLAKNSGLLVIVTEPSGVKVFMDGKLMGTTEASGTELISKPLEIDLVPVGQHTVQLAKEGYWPRPRVLSIGANRVVSFHEKLKRRFIPDTVVRTGDGPEDYFQGVLIAEHPNGDVELEVRPGVIVTIKAEDIADRRPIREEDR